MDFFGHGFNAIKAKNPDDPGSFYQIGGIHGLPYKRYSGDPIEGEAKETAWKGYCHHGSILFPTWHRAYMLLIEQEIRKEAKIIADNVSEDKAEKVKWLTASKKPRFPYFDWADDITQMDGIPSIFFTKTLQVLDPENSICFAAWIHRHRGNGIGTFLFKQRILDLRSSEGH